MRTIVLVGCGKSKAAVPACPARDLYNGPLFLSARRFAELSGHEWHIVSAKYGIVSPSRVLPPYNVTLSTMDPMEVERWSAMVASQLTDLTQDSPRVVVLASVAYEAAVSRYPGVVEYPLRGMNLFQRTAWLRDLHNCRRFQ